MLPPVPEPPVEVLITARSVIVIVKSLSVVTSSFTLMVPPLPALSGAVVCANKPVCATSSSPSMKIVSATTSIGGGSSTESGILASITPNVRTYDNNGTLKDCAFVLHTVLDDPNPRFIIGL